MSSAGLSRLTMQLPMCQNLKENQGKIDSMMWLFLNCLSGEKLLFFRIVSCLFVFLPQYQACLVIVYLSSSIQRNTNNTKYPVHAVKTPIRQLFHLKNQTTTVSVVLEQLFYNKTSLLTSFHWTVAQAGHTGRRSHGLKVWPRTKSPIGAITLDAPTQLASENPVKVN